MIKVYEKYHSLIEYGQNLSIILDKILVGAKSPLSKFSFVGIM